MCGFLLDLNLEDNGDFSLWRPCDCNLPEEPSGGERCDPRGDVKDSGKRLQSKVAASLHELKRRFRFWLKLVL